MLRYEHDLLRTEAMVYELVGAAGGVPVPAVVATGFDQAVLDRDYLLVTALPGQPWPAVREELTEPVRRALRHQLGGLTARLHTIAGPEFGYPQPGAGLRADTWRAAFLAMVDAVLDDAVRYRVALPLPVPEIAALVRSAADVLDEVTTPRLVHFDLWEGNVFVALTEPGRPRVTGLIDPERAFWGDECADFVSLALFADIEADADFLAGYRAAGGRVEFTPALRRRLTLYRAYLDLVMVVEASPRGYVDDPTNLPRDRFCRARLAEELARLAESA